MLISDFSELNSEWVWMLALLSGRGLGVIAFFAMVMLVEVFVDLVALTYGC